jgi:DNA-binding NarL/FixJ family response regulator
MRESKDMKSMKKESVKVIIVDDHPISREGLKAILSSEKNIEIIGEASSGEEAVKLVGEKKPDVVLMDIRLPKMSGIEATRAIKNENPNVSIIVLTMYDFEMYIVEAIRAGADGYLVKDASRALLLQAIWVIVNGGSFVRRDLLKKALRASPGKVMSIKGNSDGIMMERFTEREMEVLHLLTKGRGNKAIQEIMKLANVTVKKHVQNIIGKLGVSDRIEAAIKAVRMGMVE